jgi:hypothetical protein
MKTSQRAVHLVEFQFLNHRPLIFLIQSQDHLLALLIILLGMQTINEITLVTLHRTQKVIIEPLAETQMLAERVCMESFKQLCVRQRLLREALDFGSVVDAHVFYYIKVFKMSNRNIQHESRHIQRHDRKSIEAGLANDPLARSNTIDLIHRTSNSLGIGLAAETLDLQSVVSDIVLAHASNHNHYSHKSTLYFHY